MIEHTYERLSPDSHGLVTLAGGSLFLKIHDEKIRKGWGLGLVYNMLKTNINKHGQLDAIRAMTMGNLPRNLPMNRGRS